MPVILLIILYFVRIVSGLFPTLFQHGLYNYSPPEKEVKFYFYHRNNPHQTYQLFIGDINLLKYSKFDYKLSTKIIIHGWTHGKNTPWVQELSEVLTVSGLWNVITVDWTTLSHAIYAEARVHNYVVIKQVKKFVTFLTDAKYYPMSSIHIIGHSMGAQIAAAVGFGMQKSRPGKIGRITGLDPAAPLYEWPHIESLDEVLDPTDATFVDVIHTNGRYIGMISPVGHIDYYPNGGEQQWGCYVWSCSHVRACEYFIASVRKPDLFKTFSFESWQKYMNGTSKYLQVYPMGIAANPNIPNGIYFLETHDEYTEFTFSRTSLIDSFGEITDLFSLIDQE